MMSTHSKRLLLIAAVWAGVNCLTIFGMRWYQRITLEAKYHLREGILNEFQACGLKAVSPDSERVILPYRLFEPVTARAEEKFPVLIYLHGAGERGRDNARQVRSLPSLLTDAAHRRYYPCFILAPQCPSEWNWTSLRTHYNHEKQRSDDIVLRMLQQVLKNPKADPDRVYVVGFSMGSYGTWQLVADFPDVFAAAVPIAGGGSENLARSLVHVPIWTVHGDNDTTCAVDDTRKIVAAIESAGGHPRYSELPEVGHMAWRPALADTTEILAWMFRQRRTINTDIFGDSEGHDAAQ